MSYKLSITEIARSEAYRLLFRFVPKEYRHTVKTDSDFGFLIVELGDGTPRAKVDAVGFINWLKSPEATWEKLQDFIHRKTGKPKQLGLNLTLEQMNKKP